MEEVIFFFDLLKAVFFNGVIIARPGPLLPSKETHPPLDLLFSPLDLMSLFISRAGNAETSLVLLFWQREHLRMLASHWLKVTY